MRGMRGQVGAPHASQRRPPMSYFAGGVPWVPSGGMRTSELRGVTQLHTPAHLQKISCALSVA